MRPRRLTIEGFGTFRERVDIDFDGIELLALVGDTGAGKSTVIDAITFALYGSVARYDDNRNVVNAINQMSTRARVQLEFDLGDRTYTAARVVQRTSQGRASTKEARLEGNDEVLAADARSMSERVEALLGLDVDQFNRTVVLPQGRFADFLHDTPRNRQRTLRQLLGFDVYNRVGQAARGRATEARIQLEAIESEIVERAAELTAERRAELTDAYDRTVAVAEEVRARSAQRDELTRRIEPLRRRKAKLDEDIASLGVISVPTDVGELDDALAATKAQIDAALADRQEARARFQEASKAVAAGPDLTQVTMLRQKRIEAEELTERIASDQAAVTAAEQAVATASERADAVAARQTELDDAVEKARTAEQNAKAEAEAAPHVAQLDAWQHLHDRRDRLTRELSDAEEAVGVAVREEGPAKATADAAATAEDAARELLDRARATSGAAALMAALVVGEPCPVCRQTVHEKPDHNPKAELVAAEEEHTRLRSATARAMSKHDRVLERLQAAQARRDTLRDSVCSAEQELDGAPRPDEIDRLRVDATGLAQGYEQARTQLAEATKAARTHATDPSTLAARKALEDAKSDHVRATATVAWSRSRLENFESELAGAPSTAELAAAIEMARQLAVAATQADAERHRVEQAADEAQAALENARTQHSDAFKVIIAAREGVASLRPPAIGGKHLLADWDAFATWADSTRQALQSERTAVASDMQRASDDLAAMDEAIRTSCATVLDSEIDDADIASLRDQVASRVGGLKTTIAEFDRDLEQLNTQRERVNALREKAAVAEQLGYLLRSDQFEEWLMASALGSLADAASARLRELSGGQFSLELGDGSFVVRDHSNADELRSAKTLSGGETFLASLSLALALADATSELAAEGAPPIESIFLDEGFGTLDSTTLDTVAAAIEELGASGRLVGIVTHIHELANRMPVRFEVTKAGGTATIERAES